METIDDLETAFRRVVARHAVPHQSTGINTRFPGSSRAAKDLGVSRGHLHRVLTGDRESASLTSRWRDWLKSHPQFAKLQHRA